METKESRKKAAQERKAAAKRERGKAHYQQNKEKRLLKNGEKIAVRKRGWKSLYKLPLKENEGIIASMWNNNYRTSFFFHFYIEFFKILWENKNVPRPQGIVGNAKINVINAK